MSQRDADNIEASRWKKKFLDALGAHDHLEKSFINSIPLLRRGLVVASVAVDKVLRSLKVISARVRQTDFVDRYGGEEFVLLLNGIHLADAEALMNTVRQKIEKCPFHFKEKQVQITMSFGLTEFGPQELPETAFERADKALYRAKQGGRNRVCVAELPPAAASPV